MRPTLLNPFKHLITMKRILTILTAFTAASLFADTARAVETDVVVRVRSKDAKFIGTSMGGCLITIKKASTGELLASGKTAGSTGNTDLIMKSAHERGKPISDPKAGKFTATLDLEEPMLVEISASGPLAQRQAGSRVSVTQWILPGKPITAGDAIMLEMPGFVVDVLGPPAHVKLAGAPQKILIKANVTMMCGCPTEPGGIWDTTKFQVEAIVKKDGKALKTVALNYAGKTSQFSADFNAESTGVYEFIVTAYNSSNGNTGVDSTTVVIK